MESASHRIIKKNSIISSKIHGNTRKYKSFTNQDNNAFVNRKKCHIINSIFKRDYHGFKAVLDIRKNKMFEKLFLLNPEDYYRDHFYLKKREFGKAILKFEKVSKASNNPKYLYCLSFSHFLAKNYKKALKIINEAINFKSPKIKYYNLAGDICVKLYKKDKNMKFIQKADQYFREADELRPSDSTLYNRYFIKKFLYENKMNTGYAALENHVIKTPKNDIYPLLFNYKMFNCNLKKFWNRNTLSVSMKKLLRKILNDCDSKNVKRTDNKANKGLSGVEDAKVCGSIASIKESLKRMSQEAPDSKELEDISLINPIILR